MPIINTTNPNNTENNDFYHVILNTLLENKPLSQYSEQTLSKFMEYLALHTGVKTISKLDLDKLITIHAKFLAFYCIDNSHLNNNHTKFSNSHFDKFSSALRDKEQFLHLPHNHQTRIKENCETDLNTDVQAPINSVDQFITPSIHGFLAGFVNAFTAIGFESAKNKGYSKNQLRLLKFFMDISNVLTTAFYASLTTYTKNSQEPNEVLLEKMWQSFVFSLAGSASLYSLTNGISYFAKSIKNKLVKGALNVLHLAGNLSLLAKGGNNLKETAVMLGVNIASASATSVAIQSGWHFFSKRGNAAENTDLGLELSANRIENSSRPIDETSFSINDSSHNANGDDHYEVIKNTNVFDEGGYLCMRRESQCDSRGYILPNPPSTSMTHSVAHTQPNSAFDNSGYSCPKQPPIPVTSSTVNTQPTSAFDNSGYSRPKQPPIPVINSTTAQPTLPPRNLKFLSTGGIYVTSPKEVEDNVSQSSVDRFNKLSFKN